MSDTPETDAEAMDIGMDHFMVDAEFARKLERERDEARELVKALCNAYGAIQSRPYTKEGAK